MILLYVAEIDFCPMFLVDILHKALLSVGFSNACFRFILLCICKLFSMYTLNIITYLEKIRCFVRKSVADYPLFSVISGFRRDVDESCALLGYYAE
jgi:hypothetical protein